MSEISMEYAKALFMLASEKECTLEYKEALEIAEKVFNENPKYIDFLYTFAIPLDERLSALEKAFTGSIPKDVLSFLKLLCEKKHIAEFCECAKDYYALYNEFDKTTTARVTSAVELTEIQKTQLKEKLEKKSNKTVVIDYVIDESILGGLIVEIDGKIIDSSIKKHLKDMKDVINK